MPLAGRRAKPPEERQRGERDREEVDEKPEVVPREVPLGIDAGECDALELEVRAGEVDGALTVRHAVAETFDVHLRREPPWREELAEHLGASYFCRLGTHAVVRPPIVS